jgi:GTPase
MSDPGAVPTVAIVGRQNVGKSTLLNRLLGAREAISDAAPGVTRDRLERPVSWRGRTFLAVDTGGFVHRPRGIDKAVGRQADLALSQADLVLLVVDATVGIQEEDAALGVRLRRSAAPVVVVANKVDSHAQEPLVGELYGLGLGEPVAVSALHGRGAGELLDRVVALLPPVPYEARGTHGEREDHGQPLVEGDGGPGTDQRVFGIVGRPNVGKSSLFNRLVGADRSVVYEEAGTTRDAVDAVVRWDGSPVRFVDTAGFRRPSRARGVAYYGFIRTVQAIDRSHVAALVVAADEGVTSEDRRIAARVAEAGRGLVVVANKWDLVPRGERADRFAAIRERVSVFQGVPVLRVAAITGAGVGRIPPALLAVHDSWLRRVPTAEVNRVLQRAQAEHGPPRATGRIRYGSQVAAGPPRFVLFSAGPVPTAYARYLENRFREAFGLGGVPIRFTFRRRR